MNNKTVSLLIISTILLITLTLPAIVIAKKPGHAGNPKYDFPATAEFFEDSYLLTHDGVSPSLYEHGEGLRVVENDRNYGGFEIVTTESTRSIYIKFSDCKWRDEEGIDIDPKLPSVKYNVFMRIFALEYVQRGRKAPQYKGIAMEQMEINTEYDCRLWSWLYDYDGNWIGSLSHYETDQYHTPLDLTLKRTDSSVWEIEAKATFNVRIDNIKYYCDLTFNILINKI